MMLPPLLALLVLAGQPPAPESAAAAYAGCGVPMRSVALRNEAEIDVDMVTIRAPSDRVSEAQLGCLVRLGEARGEILVFPDRRLVRRYRRAQWSALEAEGLARARGWLAAHGKLKGLPRLDPAHPSAGDLARDIEALCGFERGSVFTLARGEIAFKPDALPQMLDRDEQFECLLNAAAAATPARTGLRFGFVGNEAPPRSSRGASRR